MPRPAKTLEQLVLERTFRSRRHRELLAGPVLEWETLATIQSRYVRTVHPLDRRVIRIEFERAVRDLDVHENERARRERDERALRELLDEIVEVDLGELASEIDRSMSVTWCRDLRPSGFSYRAIGERVGMTAAKVRREILWLERQLAPRG